MADYGADASGVRYPGIHAGSKETSAERAMQDHASSRKDREQSGAGDAVATAPKAENVRPVPGVWSPDQLERYEDRFEQPNHGFIASDGAIALNEVRVLKQLVRELQTRIEELESNG